MKEHNHWQLIGAGFFRQIHVKSLAGVVGCGIGNIEFEPDRLLAQCFQHITPVCLGCVHLYWAGPTLKPSRW